MKRCLLFFAVVSVFCFFAVSCSSGSSEKEMTDAELEEEIKKLDSDDTGTFEAIGAGVDAIIDLVDEIRKK